MACRCLPRARLALFATAGAVLLSAAGCSDPDQVRVLEETRFPRPAPAPPPPDQQKFRTLAAMFPHDSDGRWWFVKFSGPADVVGAHAETFRKLVESVRVSGDADHPITWDTPPGWVQEAGGPARYATLRLADRESGAEIAISSAGGTVLQNVNRWRGQLGLEDVSPSALDAVAPVRPVNGRVAIVVDMSGPQLKAPGPMMGHGHGQ
jgi:hypothetical protein